MDKIYRYYSQNGEDYLLCRFFEYKDNGYFIDIGAFDGIHLSNSYCFELLGWKGICVEPQKSYYQLCVTNRPLTTCINAACVDDDSIKEITISTDSTGLFSGVDMNNEQKNINDHYNAIGKEISQPESEIVPAVTLNALLNKHTAGNCDIDFISIDVEGFEKNVLEGLDIPRFKPRILLIETSSNEDQEDISEYLEPHGYIFARRVGPNSYFVRSQEDVDAINNIEVTCVIEKQMHPLGRDFTQQVFLDGKIIYKEMNGNSILINFEKLEAVIEERNQKVTDLLEINNELHKALKTGRIKKF